MESLDGIDNVFDCGNYIYSNWGIILVPHLLVIAWNSTSDTAYEYNNACVAL